MSMADMLMTLLIGPLKTLFEVIYVFICRLTRNPGLSIVGLSLVMNFLLLPLYNRTDAIQLEAIETEKRLKPFVSHIKKTFKGNEQFMMLQTCYRQNHCKPTDSLKGISPLLLEIPFFMAAYQFLSGLEMLQGLSFGPIPDLSRPDGILVVGGFAVNLLPILMTLINLVSSSVYTRGAPAKTKLQLYGMAALFLILLYDSPAGLVFYWTLNNLFSLVKNLLIRSRNPAGLAANAMVPLSLAGMAAVCLKVTSLKRKAVFLLLLLMLDLPALILKLRKNRPAPPPAAVTRRDHTGFFSGCLVMTLLVGLLIPSALIGSSPEEFILPAVGQNPNTAYVLYCFLMAAGTFLVWLSLFYLLASPAWKRRMLYGVWILCGAALAGYLGFGRGYGTMSSQLVFDHPIHNSTGAMAVNLLCLAGVTLAVVLILRKKRQLLSLISTVLVLTLTGMSVMNLVSSQKIITRQLDQLRDTRQEALFSLSTTGKNVVVIMLDRAIGSFIPYIFQENPQLREQFSGFTYYPNTLSFGAHTNFGLPAVMGGYEYTPAQLNRRDTLPLQAKHEEALKVMPVLFDRNGYRVTVCDPTYSGYTNVPDLSIYDDYPDIQKYITMGRFSRSTEELPGVVRERMFRYSLMRISPLCLHGAIYDRGAYFSPDIFAAQTLSDTRTAAGTDRPFEASVTVLSALDRLTGITDRPENTFLMMCNDTAHSPALLQLPDYTLSARVDNTPYDSEIPVRTNAAGEQIRLETLMQLRHYHCNAAAYLRLGAWLDYLKENGVYDNTRIILVSDHGFSLGLREDWHFDYQDVPGPEDHSDIMFYNPILFVKDFNSTGLTVDETFMTNADTPSLAFSGLIENPVNPFTGNPITSQAKQEGSQLVFLSGQMKTSVNNGNTFLPDSWARVSGDMFDPGSWQVLPAQP